MEREAVLTERDAKKVIQDAGYKVVSFQLGEPPKRTAFLFRVNQLEPGQRASLEGALREELTDADKVAIDSLGRATIVVRGDPAAAEASVSASLKSRGLATAGTETRTWPRLDATYVVAVPGMTGPAAARTIADALAGVAKVVAVHVYQDTATATLWLKEPCDALETNVKAALTPAGFSVARFELLGD